MAVKLGFVGLGVMGAPMAGHLVDGGHRVTVWNRTPTKADALRERGAAVAESLEDLASDASIVFLCVNRSEDVEACLARLAPAAKPRTLFVDHSTISPTVAAAIHQRSRNEGFRFIDAPITGGSMGAQKGQLTIFCGGDPSDIEEARPYLDCYAKRAERVGGPGAGQMMKMANQIAVGGALLGLCESLSFAEKAGLDLRQAHSLIGGGAAGSWAFDNYGPKILAHDWSPGFSVKNQRKDFAYCTEAAAALDAAIPGTDLVDGLLSEIPNEEWTTAALFDALVRKGARD